MKILSKAIVALALVSPCIGAQGRADRPELIAQRLDRGAIVMLADVSWDSTGASIVPREIWKGEGIRPGETIRIPKRDPAQQKTGPCLSVVRFNFQPAYNWMISGTDGTIVGGMPDVTIAGLRAHFQRGQIQLPGAVRTKPQPREITPSSGAAHT